MQNLKKKILTTEQYISLKNYKLVNNKKIIIRDKLHIYTNIPYFLYFSENNNNLNIAIVINNINNISKFLEDLNKDFKIRNYILNHYNKKIIICQYNKKNILIYLYICFENEFFFVDFYLNNTEQKNNIIRKISKTKGYTLTDHNIYDIKKKKYIYIKNKRVI